MGHVTIKVDVNKAGDSYNYDQNDATADQLAYALAALEIIKADLPGLFREKEGGKFIDEQ